MCYNYYKEELYITLVFTGGIIYEKRFFKALSSKALAVAVGAAVMGQAYAPTIASAADETQYISEVYLSYGKDDAVNLVSEEYCYNDKLGGLYIFSSTAADSSSQAAASADDTSSKSDEKAADSVVGTGAMAASCAGSAVLGALICFILIRRKKRDDPAA